MAILKIARMGNPILLQRAEPVADPGSPEIRRLVADMIETMETHPAPAWRRRRCTCRTRLFVFRVMPNRASDAPGDTTIGNTVVINPSVEPVGEERVLRWEGCLSIPGLRAAVPRWSRVRYSGVDCDGNPVGSEVGGFHAGVVQHEYDHLDGILYPMRMTDFRLFGFAEDLAKAGQ